MRLAARLRLHMEVGRRKDAVGSQEVLIGMEVAVGIVTIVRVSHLMTVEAATGELCCPDDIIVVIVNIHRVAVQHMHRRSDEVVREHLLQTGNAGKASRTHGAPRTSVFLHDGTVMGLELQTQQ